MTVQQALHHLFQYPECDVYIQVNVAHQVHFEWMNRNTYLNMLYSSMPENTINAYVDHLNDLIIQ